MSSSSQLNRQISALSKNSHSNNSKKPEEEEEEDELLSHKDIERLTYLWKSMKDSKKQLSGSKSFMSTVSTPGAIPSTTTAFLSNSFSQPTHPAQSTLKPQQPSLNENQFQSYSPMMAQQQQSQQASAPASLPKSTRNASSTRNNNNHAAPSHPILPSQQLSQAAAASSSIPAGQSQSAGTILTPLQASSAPLPPSIISSISTPNSQKDLQKEFARKTRESEIEIASCHEKIAKLLTQNQSSQRELDSMKAKLEVYSNSQKEVIDKSRESTFLIEQRLNDKEKLCTHLSDEVDRLKSEVQRLLHSNNELIAENESLLIQIEEKQAQNDSFNRVSHEMEQTHHQQQSQENLRLQDDLTRLATLLLSTKEFKNFMITPEDIHAVQFLRTHNAFIAYYSNFLDSSHIVPSTGLNSSTDRIPHKSSSRPLGGRNCSGCSKQPSSYSNNSPSKRISASGVQCAAEKHLWLPKDAFTFAQDFSNRYTLSLQENLIEELLFGIHAIWERHSNQSNSQDTNSNGNNNNNNRSLSNRIDQLIKANSELKKQLEKNKPFDEVQAKQKVLRLRCELSNARKSSLDGFHLTIDSTRQSASKQPTAHHSGSFENSRRGSVVGTQRGRCASSTHNSNRSSSNNNTRNERMIYFSDAVRLFTEYESELRISRETTVAHERQLKQIEDESTTCDKIIYFEGAVWIIEKTLRELKRLSDNTLNITSSFETQFHELILSSSNAINNNNNSISNTLLTSDGITALIKQFVSDISILQAALTSKFFKHKESTVNQIAKLTNNSAQATATGISASFAATTTQHSNQNKTRKQYRDHHHQHQQQSEVESNKTRRSAYEYPSEDQGTNPTSFEKRASHHARNLSKRNNTSPSIVNGGDSQYVSQQQQQQHNRIKGDSNRTLNQQSYKESSGSQQISSTTTPLQQYFTRSKKSQECLAFPPENSHVIPDETPYSGEYY